MHLGHRVKTWDDVFHVRERIKRDVLDPSFRQWLRDFSAWFRMQMGTADPGDAEVSDAIRTYAEYMAFMGLKAREFLQAPVFQMLRRHCEAGDQRVLALMKDVVAMAVRVETVLDDRIAQYVNRVKAQRHATEAAVVQELVEAGYAETVRQLHARYQRGELSFRAVAAELGLSVRELYDLFEKKGLPT
jgi:hypothetical protein